MPFDTAGMRNRRKLQGLARDLRVRRTAIGRYDDTGGAAARSVDASNVFTGNTLRLRETSRRLNSRETAGIAIELSNRGLRTIRQHCPFRNL